MALSVVILVGDPDAIRAGRGEVAVTATQAAVLLKVSESAFRNFLKQGAISAVAKISGAALYRESDVVQLRERLTADTAS